MSDIKSEKAVADRGECLITEPVRRRLPAYYRALIAMYGKGEEKVSSRQLAAIIGSAESQVRTDMLAIGCKGQKGYGYSIARLYKRIGEVMRLRDTYSAVIVGEGHTSEAVASSHLFTKRGIKLLGRFSETDTVGDGDGISKLEQFCRDQTVDIFIFTCNGATALRGLALAENMGIHGVLNLSELDLRSDTVTVRNVHVEDALMMLCSEI